MRILLLSIILLPLLTYAQPKPATDWATFIDSTNTYTLSYPADWNAKVIEGAQFWRSPMEDKHDIFRVNVNLVMQDMPTPPVTLKEYTDLSRQQINGMGGVGKVLSERKVDLNGQEAMEMVCDFLYEGSATKVKNIFFIKGKHVYLFTFTALPETYDQYEPTASKLMWSFKFNK